MQSKSKAARVLEGIEVRHERACPRKGERIIECPRCGVSFRATIYVPHTRKHDRSEWTRSLAVARSWRMNRMSKKERGALLPANAATLGELANEFIADMEAGRAKSKHRRPYKPKTVRMYAWSLRAHVIPALGERKLASIRRRELLDWVERMEFEYEPSTIHNAANPLRAIFHRALDREIIDADPSVNLRLPPEEAGPIPVDSIVTGEEAEARLGLLEPLDRVVWAVAFYAGLRMGEIRALHRRDVIGLNTLAVRGGWDDRDGLQATKTSAGERSVPIMPALRDILAAWQEQSPGEPDDLLFRGPRGGQSFDPSALRRRSYSAWEDAGLSRLKPHHARHTFASWLIAAGEPLALVSIYLGHSSSKVTERVYKHLLPDQADRTIERVERYLNSSRAA